MDGDISMLTVYYRNVPHSAHTSRERDDDYTYFAFSYFFFFFLAFLRQLVWNSNRTCVLFFFSFRFVSFRITLPNGEWHKYPLSTEHNKSNWNMYENHMCTSLRQLCIMDSFGTYDILSTEMLDCLSFYFLGGFTVSLSRS